ncbi:MAG: transglycosylase SLT domain-containing protein, partial [Candidatus Eremiobacteraeota bacterium]|nr:transglycosylase SLT domain-containing protein [Candidatus Eremiobacteraeota bacterium]
PVLTQGTKDLTDFFRSMDGTGAGEKIGAFAMELKGLAGAFADLGGALKPVAESFGNFFSMEIEGYTAGIHGLATAIRTVPAAIASHESGAEANQQSLNADLGRGAPGSVSPTPGASSAPADIDAAIAAAAAKYSIPSSLLRAVGQQETNLGTSSLYDPLSGLSRTPGNAGHGIFQLDPASGASQADLDKAASDVGFAADRAAKQLATALKATGGNITAALATYNAGGLTERGLHYAQAVEARIPGYNPADTNVADKQRIGGAKTDPFAVELTADREKEERDRLAGVATWRADYEAALDSLIAKEKDLAGTAKAGSADQLRATKDLASTERELIS